MYFFSMALSNKISILIFIPYDIRFSICLDEPGHPLRPDVLFHEDFIRDH